MLKRVCFLLTLIFVFVFNTSLRGNDTAKLYYPSTLGSYWVYEDQDGNELTREVVEGEEISGVIYNGFSYDPEMEDWLNFERHFSPYLFNVGDEWVSYLVGEELENSIEARLSQEMDVVSELTQKVLASQMPPELNVTFELIYDVEAESEENCYVLPLDVSSNEEWDSINVSATVTFTFNIEGLPDFQGAGDIPTVILDIDIQETGIILGTETVDVGTGTFEDCLKIQFQTETELTANQPNPTQEEPGESVTTLWLAPNVGIVKFHQEQEKIFLNTMSDSDFEEAALDLPEIGALLAPTVKTFELQSYEITPVEAAEEGKE